MLVELLTAVVIVGILAAIAIPTYRSYSRGAADKLAHSDIRNAVTTIEACVVDRPYPTRITSVGVMTGCTGERIRLSANTRIRYVPTGNPVRSFVLTSTNYGGAGGQGKVYCYSSAAGGGAVREVAGTLASATC